MSGVAAAKEEPSNSSWQITVGGNDATVLIDGSQSEGGETAGTAFVFLDEATIGLAAVLPEGGTSAADAYSEFFRSEEVAALLEQMTISVD